MDVEIVITAVALGTTAAAEMHFVHVVDYKILIQITLSSNITLVGELSPTLHIKTLFKVDKFQFVYFFCM